MRDFDIRNSIKNITQPTLILTGAKDRLAVPGMLNIMHEQITNSVLKTILGTGHGFNIEAPEETNNIIWNFIQNYIS